MSRFLSWLLLFAIVLTGCEPEPRVYEQVLLPDGTKLDVVKIKVVTIDSGESGLLLEYVTEIPIKDTAQLRAEAIRVWAVFRVDVEKGGHHAGILRARERGDGGIVSNYMGYGFVWTRNEDGNWVASN